MSDLDKVLDETVEEKTPFGKNEEEAITSLIIDHPEFFANIVPHLSDTLFSSIEVRYVIANILNYHKEFQVFPTRGILRDRIFREITVDAPYADDIVQIINRKSNPREIPAIRALIVKWARHKAYDILFNSETVAKFHAGDYEYIEQIFERARRVQEVGGRSLWFFKELERLFVDDDSERFTTGISQLDVHLNDGGPGRKEMLVWMAPTGVGKSIMLINNAISNSKRGKNVLLITLELSDLRSAVRALGALTDRPVTSKLALKNRKEELISMAGAFKANGAADIVIHELPPDEVSVDAVYALIDELKRNDNFVPDVVIIDYLELLISRREADNINSYTRQKAVATQIRGLAKNANVFIITATQTNRGGNEKEDKAGNKEMITVSNIAESYGKAMPMDYLISINQSDAEYQNAQNVQKGEVSKGKVDWYIAKNRNGRKFVSVQGEINYTTMGVKAFSTQ